MTAGTLICFMCEVPVSCRKGSFANLDDHMKNIHKVISIIFLLKNIFQIHLLDQAG